MSIVNADGNLTDPHKFLLRTAQGLTNSLMAPDPESMHEHDDRDGAVYAANGEYAGVVGGTPHRDSKGQEEAERHRGAGTAATEAPPVKGAGRCKKRQGNSNR